MDITLSSKHNHILGKKETMKGKNLNPLTLMSSPRFRSDEKQRKPFAEVVSFLLIGGLFSL